MTVTDPDAHRRLRADADMEVVELGWDRELADAQRSSTRGSPGCSVTMRRASRVHWVAAPGLTAADHVAVRLGLHDALLAIILGDRLAERDSQELLGGWADLVIRRR